MGFISAPGTTSVIFNKEAFNGQCIVQSYVIGIKKLCFLRTIYLILVISTLVCNVLTCTQYKDFFFRFHNMSYLLLALYITLSTIFTWCHLLSRNRSYTPYSGAHWGLPFGYFLLYSLCLIFNIFVSMAFWSLESREFFVPDRSPLETVVGISMYLGNLIMVLSEALLGCNPMHLVCLPLVVLVSILYLAVFYAASLSLNYWVYKSLNYQEDSMLALTLIGCGFVGGITLFILLYVAHVFRDHYGIQSFALRNGDKVNLLYNYD